MATAGHAPPKAPGAQPAPILPKVLKTELPSTVITKYMEGLGKRSTKVAVSWLNCRRIRGSKYTQEIGQYSRISNPSSRRSLSWTARKLSVGPCVALLHCVHVALTNALFDCHDAFN